MGILNYDFLSRQMIETIEKENMQHKIISIDLETKVLDKNDFLSGERILAFGIVRRVGGEIKKKIIVLQEDTDEAEMKLLNEVGWCMGKIQPLVLLGYNIGGYDLPLLNIKLKWYENVLREKNNGQKSSLPNEYWNFRDAIVGSYMLDMMYLLKFIIAEYDKTTPRYKSLDDVVNHPMYSHLPLLRRKGIASGDCTQDKGKTIYELWKSKNPDFERYLEGDVVDVLVLMEEWSRKTTKL